MVLRSSGESEEGERAREVCTIISKRGPRAKKREKFKEAAVSFQLF